MPDWEAIVRSHLAGLVLAPEERSEVIEELAAHLEETCAELCEQGISEEAGVRLALSQVTDWQDLRRRIQIAKTKEKIMTNRVTQFWVPALVTLFLAMVLLPIIQMIGPKPWMPASEGHLRMTPVAVVYLSWLLTLPLIGAMGAYLSNRAGGSQRAVFSSIVFPVLPYLLFFVVGLPLILIFDDRVARNFTVPAFFVGLSAWAIFPAAALLAGGLAVQLFASRRLGSRRIAGG
jgi:hypothetical protein